MKSTGSTWSGGNADKSKNMARARSRVLGFALLSFALMSLAVTPLMAQDWPMFGKDTTNTASASSSISVQNVNTLKPRWIFTTGGDVSARACVSGGKAFFPDWGGNIWAVNSNNGQLIWSNQISSYFPGAPSGSYHSRTTPTLIKSTLYIATQEGAWLLALDWNTGTLLWKTQLESVDPYAIISASPAASGNVLYTGVASNSELVAPFPPPGFVCCTARGSVVAVNASTGAILWKTYTVPTGYSGGGVWGSNPVVDTARQTVFVGTGNNYSDPTDPAYLACIAAGGTADSCISPSDHVDSILALNMNTGAVKWATRLVNWHQDYQPTNGSDFWNGSCLEGDFANCPTPTIGPDYDFGSDPNEITYKPASGPPRTIIGAGQKSGIYYALNPDTGAVLWQTQVGPGSILGGIEWGSASDGTNIYVAISNYFGIPYAGGNAGSWAALNPETGAIVWQTADPNGAIDLGALAVANGIVYAPSMSATVGASTMFALNAANGSILWSFDAGSSVIAGASIVDNDLYWGSGYAHLGVPGFTGNNKFYAFTPNGT